MRAYNLWIIVQNLHWGFRVLSLKLSAFPINRFSLRLLKYCSSAPGKELDLAADKETGSFDDFDDNFGDIPTQETSTVDAKQTQQVEILEEFY